MTIQDDNLYERMRSFFDRIDDFEIAENEVIELAWIHRDADEAWRAQYVPDLDQAALRAVALGPDHDILILVRKRLEKGVQGNASVDPLVAWRSREKRPGDHYPPPGLDFVCLSRSSDGQCRYSTQHFANGSGTCEAVMFTYPYRPYKLSTYRRTRPWLLLVPNNRRGARG